MKKFNKIKRISNKRKIQLEIYKKLSNIFLRKTEFCECCKIKAPSEVHHKKGRAGELLNNMEYFMAVCRECHSWIHANPKLSYVSGFMIKRNGPD